MILCYAHRSFIYVLSVFLLVAMSSCGTEQGRDFMADGLRLPSDIYKDLTVRIPNKIALGFKKGCIAVTEKKRGSGDQFVKGLVEIDFSKTGADGTTDGTLNYRQFDADSQVTINILTLEDDQICEEYDDSREFPEVYENRYSLVRPSDTVGLLLNFEEMNGASLEYANLKIGANGEEEIGAVGETQFCVRSGSDISGYDFDISVGVGSNAQLNGESEIEIPFIYSDKPEQHDSDDNYLRYANEVQVVQGNDCNGFDNDLTADYYLPEIPPDSASFEMVEAGSEMLLAPTTITNNFTTEKVCAVFLNEARNSSNLFSYFQLTPGASDEFFLPYYTRPEDRDQETSLPSYQIGVFGISSDEPCVNSQDDEVVQEKNIVEKTPYSASYTINSDTE